VRRVYVGMNSAPIAQSDHAKSDWLNIIVPSIE
jgi:hypothetical protein